MAQSSISTRALSADKVLAVAATSFIKMVAKVFLNGRESNALTDSCSSESYIHPSVIECCSLLVYHSTNSVSTVSTSLSLAITEHCQENLQVNGRDYRYCLGILPDCCVDGILRQDFQKLHNNITLSYARKLPLLVICRLRTFLV